MTTSDSDTPQRLSPSQRPDSIVPHVVLAVVVLTGIVAWVVVKRQSQPTFPPYWEDDLVRAAAKGRAEGRPVLALFHGWPLREASEKLIQDVLMGEGREETFRKYRYILVHVSTSTRAPLAVKWKIDKLPTTVILDSSGREIRRYSGYMDAPQFWNEFVVPGSPSPASRPATVTSAPGS